MSPMNYLENVGQYSFSTSSSDNTTIASHYSNIDVKHFGDMLMPSGTRVYRVAERLRNDVSVTGSSTTQK